MNVARQVKWLQSELDYLTENYRYESAEKMASELGRSVDSVKNKIYRMGLKKVQSWTQEEIDYLYNLDSRDTTRRIAKKLGRTERSVASKMNALGLTLEEFRTAYAPNYIASALNMTREGFIEYLKKRNVRMVRLAQGRKKGVYQVDGEDFWKMVKNHPHDFNLKGYERMSILPEPDWLDDAIKECEYKPRIRKEWTVNELNRLQSMRDDGRGYKDIAYRLGRSVESVRSMVYQKSKTGGG